MIDGSHNHPSPRRDPQDGRKTTLLIFSQVFVPDSASVGQHMADVAFEMARRGHRVRVFTSARGYDDPTIRYPARENMNGVEVRRLPLASFGKKSILTRLAGTFSFMAQALFTALFARDVAGIFFSTSPPLVGFIVSAVARLRGLPTAYWLMDLNPDQLIALGRIGADWPAARLLRWINRFILSHSSLVVVLDRFMARRVDPDGQFAAKMRMMPPWPHEDHIQPPSDPNSPGPSSEINPFRTRHGLVGQFVLMYSGNHSPSNPLDTLLQAALQFRGDADLRFLFVGGGTDKPRVEAFIRENSLDNALALPYQPLSELHHSLSSADVHVVSLGEQMVGIIHPCKVYGAMAAGRPILYLGPRPSHITDLLDQHSLGWHVRHGDVEGAVRAIAAARSLSASERLAMGERARAVMRQSLSQQMLCNRFCDELERTFWPQEPPAVEESRPAGAATASVPAV